MKKVIKSFTFWFVILGVVVIVFNLLNFDDMNIIMIGLNPILNLLSSSAIRSDIAAIPYLWHILSLLTMATYGLAVDGIKFLIRTVKNK